VSHVTSVRWRRRALSAEKVPVQGPHRTRVTRGAVAATRKRYRLPSRPSQLEEACGY
jgi:hypothetical protein